MGFFVASVGWVLLQISSVHLSGSDGPNKTPFLFDFVIHDGHQQVSHPKVRTLNGLAARIALSDAADMLVTPRLNTDGTVTIAFEERSRKRNLAYLVRISANKMYRVTHSVEGFPSLVSPTQDLDSSFSFDIMVSPTRDDE